MKRVEFTTTPPPYEIVDLGDNQAIVRFYCDAQEYVREQSDNDGDTEHVAYVCTCYEMRVRKNNSLDARISHNYDMWLERAIQLDGGLDSVKREKIAKSKDDLATYIATHPITSSAHSGQPGIYSVTEEKQALMTSQYISYQAEKQVNPNAVLTWNESGKACEVWTEEEFLQLVIEIKNYVYPLVSHQQKIEEEITAAETLDAVEAVVIDYDTVH